MKVSSLKITIQAEEVLNYIEASAGMAVCGVHNGFGDQDFMHYRHVALAVELDVRSGLGSGSVAYLVEVQLHLQAFFKFREICEGPRKFFTSQGDLCGDDAQRRKHLKKRMNVVHTIGTTHVLLSVFLIYIKARTGKLTDEERDDSTNDLTCPPMPPALHYLYQEAM